jgi:hypothetical protein
MSATPETPFVHSVRELQRALPDRFQRHETSHAASAEEITSRADNCCAEATPHLGEIASGRQVACHHPLITS